MKRLIIVFALLALLLTGCARVAAGDVDGNGAVDGRDDVRLMKYLAGWDVAIDGANADITGDGTVDMRDEEQLLRMLAEDNETEVR